MSLPAGHEQVLDHMDGALRASDPQLVSMFALFARLNAGEPVGVEPLARPRPRARRVRWLRAGTTIYAFVLVPVMFAMITIGALLSSRTHSATPCDAGYSAGGGSPWIGPAGCQLTVQKTTASGRLASCVARIPAVRFVARSSAEALTPPARATAAASTAAC